MLSMETASFWFVVVLVDLVLLILSIVCVGGKHDPAGSYELVSSDYYRQELEIFFIDQLSQ